LSYTLPLQRQIVATVSPEKEFDGKIWEHLMPGPTARRFIKQKLIEAGEVL